MSKFKVGDCSIKPSFNYKFAYRKLKIHTQCIQEMMENSDQPAKHFSQFLEKGLHEIGDKAHYASTGPAVHDVYWEIRQLAYENI